MNRRTKIVATLGPATDSDDMLTALLQAGVDVFRLNMSHARPDWVQAIVPRVRRLAEKQGRLVAVLLDTQGPAIRTGDLPEPLELKPGETFTFTVRGHRSDERLSVDVNYDGLVQDLHAGDTVLVDNGMMRMQVISTDEHRVVCRVLTAGVLGNRRHINLPGVKVNLPAITEKDHQDIQAGIAAGVDFVALSFVREAGDMRALRQLLDASGAAQTGVIAKIEDQSAIRNIEEIIAASDGIMVARGDLGIECPYETLPLIQRQVVRAAQLAMKPVIIATHLLESMIQNPMPTRAEITDVSNAVYENADAVMLSGETSIGRYPLACIEVLQRVANRVETGQPLLRVQDDLQLTHKAQLIASTAVHLVDRVEARGLCVFTQTGRLAGLCAALRPKRAPIYAFSPSPVAAQRLCLRHGVTSFIMPAAWDAEATIRAAERMLIERGLVAPGERIVAVTNMLAYGEVLGAVQLREIAPVPVAAPAGGR
jgi:pyruvate kinase